MEFDGCGPDWICHHKNMQFFDSDCILTSSVIYYWTDARQLGINLFYVIKNSNIRKKSFNDDVIYTSILQ